MYLALYRKWRSETFDEVVSQPHITTTLKNQLITEKTAHSYLFTGSRGTGKTTCAKILAKAVNCLNLQGGNPCLECEICKGIESGSVTDVLEIDAASNNGVDDIRELRELAHYIPAQAKYRVYIIDEVHMLSTSAFNALLKIMEEPPEHVKFILATTEVHKVPVTILSRCQRFDFRRITTEDIEERLLYITKQEGALLSTDAAQMLARLADGGMRDALSLLDVCLAYTPEGEQVSTDIVAQVAGVAQRELLFELADCIIDKSNESGANCSRAIEIIDTIHNGSKDLSRLCEELIAHFRSIMLLKAVSADTSLVACLPNERERLVEQSKRIPMSRVFTVLNELQDTGERMAKSVSKRTELEVSIIRLCTGMQPAAVAPAKVAVAATPEPVPKFTQPPSQESASSQPEKQMPEAKSKKPPANQELKKLVQWEQIVEVLAKSAPHLTSLLDGAQGYSFANTILIDTPNHLLGAMIKRDGNVKLLADAVLEVLGESYKIRVRKSEVKGEQTNNTQPVDDFLNSARQAGVNVNIKE